MKKMRTILLVIVMLVLEGYQNNNIEQKNKKKDNNNLNVNEEVHNVKVTINEKEYQMIIEDNETVKSFLKLLPLDLVMNELNGNEKYYYLDKTLPTNSYNPNKIEAGDVMLYGNNCIVIFYKSFNTTYSYTKIGHIDNLEELGNKDIGVKFEIA